MLEKLGEYYQKIINTVATIVIVIIVFSIGYYMGYGKGMGKNVSDSKKISQNIIENDNNIVDLEKLIQNDENLKLFKFIKPNEPKICQDPYYIKGVYRDGFGYFYDKTNTFYQRVKPDLCFISVESARDYAGFIQKF